MTHMGVYSKKLTGKSYNLATFREPLTRSRDDLMPEHYIEQPDPVLLSDKT